MKLRGVERLFHLEDEVEIAKRVGRLRKEQKCGRLRRSGKDSLTAEGKEKEKKYLNFRIKKMEKEITQGDFKGLIIDRSQTQEEIDPQIDVAAKEFQKLESSERNREGYSQFYDGEGMFCRGGPG